MSKILGNPRSIAISIICVAVLVISIFGGALGNTLGFGFFASSLPAIQLPAEKIVDGFNTPVGKWDLMNTMVTTWLAMLVLIVVSLIIRRNLKDVPGRLQALFEVVMEFFLSLCEQIAGKEKARRFFPLVFTIFIFIVAANWMGVLPGFGTVGRIAGPEEIAHHHDAHDYHDPALVTTTHESKESKAKHHGSDEAQEDGHDSHLGTVKLHVFRDYKTIPVAALSPGSLEEELTFSEYDEKNGNVGEGKRAGHLVPFLRSANTDLNMSLAIALIAMVMVHFWGFSILGFFGHAGKFISFKSGPIGFFVGILELISELGRIISFTFRLFGNIFAGEVLLMAMAFLLPLIGIIPFLGLELFVGLIQAFVFAMLTLVFASMASISHNDGDHH
ncbi:MAG: F-type H+-transporting ATPase subunit a [Chloroflexi bacterium]|nr:MAG: F-type H+-transporting ATPase subunit a [Chloroflexota bacterium]